MTWYGLVARRKQDKPLKSEQLLSSFKYVFGNDLTALDAEWRHYMRSLQTDIEKVLKEGK